MDLRSLLHNRRDELQQIADRYGVSNIRVFGSVARGEASRDSDIDLLIDMEADRSLLDLGRFALDVQDALGRRVDVVEARSLHWYIRDRRWRHLRTDCRRWCRSAPTSR